MTVRQAVRLVAPEGASAGEIVIALPMDVQLFARFAAPLGKAGWVIPDRHDHGSQDLADVPEFLYDIAKLAWEGVTYDGEHHKQWFLAEILERCGVPFPEALERGVPA